MQEHIIIVFKFHNITSFIKQTVMQKAHPSLEKKTYLDRSSLLTSYQIITETLTDISDLLDTSDNVRQNDLPLPLFPWTFYAYFCVCYIPRKEQETTKAEIMSYPS